MCIHPRCERRPAANLFGTEYGGGPQYGVELCDMHWLVYARAAKPTKIELHPWYKQRLRELDAETLVHLSEEETMTAANVPNTGDVTIGRIVIYKSKIDNGPGNDVLSPAMVIRTRETTVPEVVERWGPEPTLVGKPGRQHKTAPRPEAFVAELPDDTTVDLVVFGLGKTYREYTVRQGGRRGEWMWPTRK